MSPSPARTAILLQGLIRRLLGVAVALVVICTYAALTTIPARADSAVSAGFTIRGAGWGHGWGMSQYGAYGAARKGLTWRQILAFYYPGTRLSTMSAGTKIKVGISADNDNSLRVLPATGLTVRDTAGHRYTVPTGGEVHLVANQPLRHRLPAQLPDKQRNLRDKVDRADHRHLVVLHWFQDRQGGASEWFGASVPRDRGADQERDRRADRQ
jgi:hypothetical protein